MYAPIQPAKVFERVAEQIEKRILDGELRSGDRLPTERELADQFQVSRTAVREAMKILSFSNQILTSARAMGLAAHGNSQQSRDRSPLPGRNAL